MLDTNAVHHDLEPRPWYTSWTLWWNVVSAVVAIGGIFADPTLGFDPRIVAVAAAIITAGNVALRVMKTSMPIAGTPAAAKVEAAKVDIAVASAATGQPQVAPPST